MRAAAVVSALLCMFLCADICCCGCYLVVSVTLHLYLLLTVVCALWVHLIGMDGRQGVFVIAATNRPEMIDPAMLRPGRLDKLLMVPLPKLEEREAILRTQVRNTPLVPEGVDMQMIVQRAEGFRCVLHVNVECVRVLVCV